MTGSLTVVSIGHGWLRPTLQGAGILQCQAQVLFTQPLDRLVLGNLYAGAHITLPMQEEGEGARQVLTVGTDNTQRQHQS